MPSSESPDKREREAGEKEGRTLPRTPSTPAASPGLLQDSHLFSPLGRSNASPASSPPSALSPRLVSSRTVQTSGLLERIARLQSRLNERVSLAGLAHSIALDKRKSDVSNPRDSLSVEKDSARITIPSRVNMHPYVVRKLDPSPADAAEDGISLSSSVSSSSLNLRSASTPTTGRYGPTLTHLDKSTDGQRDERESNFFETKALKARISELEDALRDSEAESRKLRHTVTQIQEAFARESAELSTVSMSLYASKESENALRSQLKNLEAEREILKLKKTQTQKQDDELNEIKENTARKDLHSNASADARIQELEQELKNKDHKIARLETILIETASIATAKTEPAKVSEVLEKPAVRDDLNQETGQRPATSRERDKHSDRQRQREAVRDPEMEQYEQVPGPSAPTHVEVDKEKERKKERDRERDRERSRAARMINALEVALIDIRECMIKSMGPRKHPPKSSRNRPLDESAVSAYREEIIVEIMQRKSAASALEQDLNTANSRREAAEAQAAAVVAAVADAEEIAGDEAQRPEAEANAEDIGGEEGLAASEQEKLSAKQTKIWEARVRSLENTLVQKNEELRVTKESQDKKQKLRIDEVEAEVSLMKGRVKSLMQQIEQSKKTSGSAHAVHAQDEAILDDRDEVQKDQLEQCELLGSGAFAEVYRGWWRRPVAIKKFRSVARQEQIDSFARETKILRLMNHTGIARFCGVFTDLPDLNIILECVVGMSFHDLCHADKNKPLPEAEVKGLSLQLSDVMCYVHSLQVVHRDLKPTNVLVSSTGIVKLIDFGLAHLGDHGRISKASIIAGTPVYLPPEVLREERVTNKLVVLSAKDVYSFGIILWEMLARDLPFQGMSLKQMMAAVAKDGVRPPIPDAWGAPIKDIIQKCWHADYLQRPDFEEVSREMRDMGAPAVPVVQKAQFHTILAM